MFRVDPFGACIERVDCNSIQCTKCPRQVSLLPCRDVFVCITCPVIHLIVARRTFDCL